jgi:uncharacterized membrane protein
MNRPSNRTLAWLYAELPALEAAGIITPAASEKIRQRYGPVVERSAASIVLVGLSALGALFIIGGLILLFGSNWEHLSRPMRAAISIGVLLSGQALVAYTLLKRRDSNGWREGSGVYLTGAIGACIALIGQTYHLPGSMDSFLWAWMLLAWPLIYLLNASTVAVLAMGAVLWWAAEAGSGHSAYLWLFLAGLLPHVFLAALRGPGPRFQFLSWFFVPFLLCAAPAFDVAASPTALLLGYSLLFGLFLLFGLSPWAGHWFNPWRIVGGVSILALAVVFTFSGSWAGLASEYVRGTREPITWRLYLGYILMLALYAPLLIHHLRLQNRAAMLWALFPLLMLLCVSLMHARATENLPVVLCNAYVLVLAITCLREGLQRAKLGITNAGMVLMAIFAIARFVDIDIPFLLRGIMFILIGVAFLAGNIILARRIRDAKGASA